VTSRSSMVMLARGSMVAGTCRFHCALCELPRFNPACVHEAHHGCAGLLYMKTKGQAEEAVKSMGLPYTTIMRPGALASHALQQLLSKLGHVSSLVGVHPAQAYSYVHMTHARPAGPRRYGAWHRALRG
jgi:hypothetical protein